MSDINKLSIEDEQKQHDKEYEAFELVMKNFPGKWEIYQIDPVRIMAMMRENERLRDFVEQVANPPKLMPHGLNENDQCICCGFSHKLMAKHAKKALSNKESEH